MLYFSYASNILQNSSVSASLLFHEEFRSTHILDVSHDTWTVCIVRYAISMLLFTSCKPIVRLLYVRDQILLLFSHWFSLCLASFIDFVFSSSFRRINWKLIFILWVALCLPLNHFIVHFCFAISLKFLCNIFLSNAPLSFGSFDFLFSFSLFSKCFDFVIHFVER